MLSPFYRTTVSCVASQNSLRGLGEAFFKIMTVSEMEHDELKLMKEQTHKRREILIMCIIVSTTIFDLLTPCV